MTRRSGLARNRRGRIPAALLLQLLCEQRIRILLLSSSNASSDSQLLTDEQRSPLYQNRLVDRNSFCLKLLNRSLGEFFDD